MTFSFTILGRLSGTNEIIKAAAYNRFAGGAMRKKDKTFCIACVQAAMGRQKVRFAKPVTLSFAWIEPNAKRDLDNVTGGQKVILDALVLCGVIPNDTREWVKGISHTFPPPDKENPRVEVTVTECEEVEA